MALECSLDGTQLFMVHEMHPTWLCRNANVLETRIAGTMIKEI